MTTIFDENEICVICGESSTQIILGSTSSSGEPDLDMRPNGLARSTLGTLIHKCPKCGYCAPNISQSIEKSLGVVTGKIYQQQLCNPHFPELANAFLCCALLYNNAGQYSDAGWGSLHAVWVCDDAESVSGSKECRRKTVELWKKALEFGQEFGREAGVEESIMADLLRRSGRFKLAMSYCNVGLTNGETEKWNLNILLFQKALINQRDITCHSLAEIPVEKDEEDPTRITIDTKLFYCTELIALAEHSSKAETKQRLIKEGIRSYLRYKLISDPSSEDRVAYEAHMKSEGNTAAGIEQVAHLEHRPKSETEYFLIQKGINSYLDQLKEAVKSKPSAGQRISKREATRLIAELESLIC